MSRRHDGGRIQGARWAAIANLDELQRLHEAAGGDPGLFIYQKYNAPLSHTDAIAAAITGCDMDAGFDDFWENIMCLGKDMNNKLFASGFLEGAFNVRASRVANSKLSGKLVY